VYKYLYVPPGAFCSQISTLDGNGLKVASTEDAESLATLNESPIGERTCENGGREIPRGPEAAVKKECEGKGMNLRRFS
jgi:hypothetical protein